MDYMKNKIFSVPLNPKLSPDQYLEFYNFLAEYKDYIRDVYFTSRIKPFMQDAMGDVFIIQEDYQYAIDAALYIQNTLGIPVSATFNNISVPPTQINLDTFIDCHCARPYTQHKVAIDNIKNSIIDKITDSQNL